MKKTMFFKDQNSVSTWRLLLAHGNLGEDPGPLFLISQCARAKIKSEEIYLQIFSSFSNT